MQQYTRMCGKVELTNSDPSKPEGKRDVNGSRN